MPLFSRDAEKLRLIRPTEFSNEKELQGLLESNLEEVFSCRFVATEFSTGPVHGGRIDTLAISEDNNPVIIEYKAVESSQLVNQSLFYLSWISDHRGDFEVACRKQFPESSEEIDWSSIRVICIAPEYKKYDIHAVKMMGANIELWQYRLFSNHTFLLEEVFRRAAPTALSTNEGNHKNPVMVQAGKKAALTRLTGTYSIEEHETKAQPELKHLIDDLREFMLGLDDAVEEVPKKYYVAYKISKNFACVEIHRSKILVFLKVDAESLPDYPPICRDVSNIGHFGTGDFEVSVSTQDDLEVAKPFIELSFGNIGGS